MPVKIFKNCLTSGGGFGIIVELARAKAREKRATRTLKTIQRKKRAKEEEPYRNIRGRKTAKIPKSTDTKVFARIKRKSLILAQDERWRRA